VIIHIPEQTAPLYESENGPGKPIMPVEAELLEGGDPEPVMV
jgi:hypothetical protein